MYSMGSKALGSLAKANIRGFKLVWDARILASDSKVGCFVLSISFRCVALA